MYLLLVTGLVLASRIASATPMSDISSDYDKISAGPLYEDFSPQQALDLWHQESITKDTRITRESSISRLPTTITKNRGNISQASRPADFSVVGLQINEDQKTKDSLIIEDETEKDELKTDGGQAGAAPFAVKIDDSQFYGGLVTYSHEQHPARVCRVMNPCIRPDGTLILPQWMQRHDSTLNFQCGQTKLEFSLPDTSPPEYLHPMDLVGLREPRPSMPDFLQDFIPSAVVFDLVYGDHEVSKTCHSRIGKTCDGFPGLAQNFKPAVFLSPRIKELQEKKSWVQQFVKLMKPKNMGIQAKLLYGMDSAAKTNGMQCFRTAFFTRGPYNKNIIMSDHLRGIHFLELNNIAKKARKVVRQSQIDSDAAPLCNINITMSNRKLIDGASNRLIGRYILNIPDLRKAIKKQAARIPRLRVKVAALTLEGRPLRWQINAMQKTDIWVAGHGSLLTNMIFLRENSTVMEIQPFTYYPKRYENLAMYLAHVNYDRYIAHPDVEAFQACMAQMYPKRHQSFKKALDFVDKFTKAAAKYTQSDNTHSLVLHAFNNTALQHVPTCAQMQRLDTNAKNLAIAVVRHARLRCGLPRPKLRRSNV